MIGDALTDIEAGLAAGIKTLILVKTGRGQKQLLSPQTINCHHFFTTDHLLSAINIILSTSV
jgi:histidinol phosphatase-like enzyme